MPMKEQWIIDQKGNKKVKEKIVNTTYQNVWSMLTKTNLKVSQ